MKYEQQLKTRMNPSWRFYYMAYGQLKQLLKQKSDHWLEQDEEEFEEMIGSELSKVCRFLRHQLDQIMEQTQQLEKQCHQRVDNMIDANFTTRVTALVFDLNDTAQFLHTNRMAFDKMVKKHDRYTSFSFRTSYNRMVGTSSIDTYTQQLDTLMTRLCYLYDLGRQSQYNDLEIEDSIQSPQQDQDQQCSRFWIHPDNINEVKAICLFQLPMLSNQPTCDSSPSKTSDYSQKDFNLINSVYLDNSNFDNYRNQAELCNSSNSNTLSTLKKDSFADEELVRCRWYGQDTSVMHLKLHQHDNYQRCIIKGTTLASCLGGGYHLGDKRASTASSDEESTRHQIQESIRQQQLEPKCRITCQRTTFHQRESSFYLNMDTNIKLYKVSSNGVHTFNNKKKHKGQHDEDGSPTVSIFPHALLTIHHTGKYPSWLSQLLSSHLVHAVPRFSLFVHAIFLFYGDQLALSFITPWWMVSMTEDIRKPPCNRIGLTRTASSQPLINGHRQTSFDGQSVFTSQHISIPFTDNTPAIMDEKNQCHVSSTLRWWRRRRQNEDHHHHQRLDSSTEQASLSVMDMDTNAIINRGRERMIYNHNKLQNNKLTEPKTFFANERTFITWLQFCAVLLTVALSLFNHGDKISRWMGALFLSMTCMMAFYALGRFQYRSWQLRTRRYVLRYDDVFGPTALCFFLVIAMIINIYLRLPLFEL